MAHKIVLDDDSFWEEGTLDDYDVLSEIANVSCAPDYEFEVYEPDVADDLLLMEYGAAGMETVEEAQSWRNRIRSTKPSMN